jgi:succinate dehydrogenase/fumarate reductase flavoprotein subunit
VATAKQGLAASRAALAVAQADAKVAAISRAKATALANIAIDIGTSMQKVLKAAK